MIFLDRDYKLGGSFHALDIERLGAEKVIAISSAPRYNEEAKKRGVTSVALKDYGNLDALADTLVAEITDMHKSFSINDANIVHPLTGNI